MNLPAFLTTPGHLGKHTVLQIRVGITVGLGELDQELKCVYSVKYHLSPVVQNCNFSVGSLQAVWPLKRYCSKDTAIMSRSSMGLSSNNSIYIFPKHVGEKTGSMLRVNWNIPVWEGQRSGGREMEGGGARPGDAELIREQIQSQAWIGLTNEPQVPCSGFQT